MRPLFLAIVLTVCSGSLASQAADDAPLGCKEAASHVGEVRTVCGRLVQGSYRPDVKGEPTFLNCGARYPRQNFMWLIWGEDRASYRPAPEQFEGQCVCGSGAIAEYRGKPEVVHPKRFGPASTSGERGLCN